MENFLSTSEVQTTSESTQQSGNLTQSSLNSTGNNENVSMKNTSRRRKPLRPWSLSSRTERPGSSNKNIEPIVEVHDHSDSTILHHSSANIPSTDSHLHDVNQSSNWPKQLSTIEEILQLYHVETNGSVQCIRCGSVADQDNLLEHITIHYPYKCYSCGFYCDSSSDLDEHHRTHSCHTPVPQLPSPEPIPLIKKTSESHHEKSTKTKVHRCRQCPFISNIKEDYWTHYRSHIRADKILECPSCPFVTEYKHHLEYHLRNHLGSKPFKCSKCDYACVNLSMLRSHKKSHFRHLLFKCSNCSFESKQYQTLQEHLQSEGHEIQMDESIEEFLQEYSHSNSILQTTTTTQNNSRPSKSKKRKTTSIVPTQRRSSHSSMDSYASPISPVSLLESSALSFPCQQCEHISTSKEELNVHLFEHACKNSEFFNRTLFADSTTKFMELFQGQFNDFLGPYQQYLTQQLSSNPHSGYSLLSSCLSNSSTPTSTRQETVVNDNEDETIRSVDRQTQVDEWQIQRLFECFHCQMIFKDFAMYCTHKQFHYSAENPFRCAQCGEEKVNQYDFFVHVAQQAHELT